MTIYKGGCTGPGSPDAYCNCVCHIIPDEGCDDTHCAPVTAKAADNVRLRHVNRDPDKAKRTTRRGSRSLRRS